MLARMGTPTADPYAALAEELGRIGRRLDALGAELLRLRPVAGPGTGPAAAAWAPAAGPEPGQGAEPWSHSGDARPGGEVASTTESPAGHASHAAPPWPPTGWGQPQGYAPPPQPARPRSPFRRLTGAQLLAWTGGAVTLFGVVLLLILAASRDWFSPQARVVAGAVLGLTLIGLGVWLHRKESARAGALALAATGFAALYLVVAAATAIYGYLPTVPALVAALAVAAGGLGLAALWRSQLLGGGVVVGATVLAPAIVTDWRLVALALALQFAALPAVLRGRWPVLMLVAAAGPVLYGTIVGLTGAERTPMVAVVLAGLAVGLGTASITRTALRVQPVAALVAVSPLPLLVTAAEIEHWGGAGLSAVAVVALVAFGFAARADAVLWAVATSAAAVALFMATQLALDGATVTTAVLAEALVVTVVATVARSRILLAIGGAFGVAGTLVAIGRDAPLGRLLQIPTYQFEVPRSADLVTAAGVSALVLALAIAALFACGRAGLVRPDSTTAPLWVPIGLVGLYGATSLVVTLALLVSADQAGFTAGHALVTVSWTVAALVLLARGISRRALRVAGMVLVGAAVAKLVLFDLVALDGIARVAAFLGAGLVLLAAGTRYARLVAEASKND